MLHCAVYDEIRLELFNSIKDIFNLNISDTDCCFKTFMSCLNGDPELAPRPLVCQFVILLTPALSQENIISK